MGIHLPQGLDILNTDPIDSRLVLSKNDMLTVVQARMPDVYFAICSDDGQLYIYNKDNEEDPLTGRFRLLSSDVIAALKRVVDNSSIIFLDKLEKLTIKGYNEASQGQMLVKDLNDGLAWVDPVSLDALNAAVAAAQEAARQAGTNATLAGSKATEAAESADAAYESAIAIRDMYWFGTMEEYNNLPVIEENKIYTVLMG